MELNANFDERCAIHAAQMPWKPSPMEGVDRRMLDRLGGEVARATTIVRYAPESVFSSHVHTGGEEFIVLEGVFQDEHGGFPVGSYIRNPPESSHTPGSKSGCTIFVKLWQFDLADRTQVRINTAQNEFTADSERDGVEVMSLFHDQREDVSLEKWHPGQSVELNAVGGMEILLLEGSYQEGDEHFEIQSWVRLPKGHVSSAVAGPSGARVWIKKGHLSDTPRPPQRGN